MSPSSVGAPAGAQAVDDLIALVATVDGWLVEQEGFDAENLQHYLELTLPAGEMRQVYDRVLGPRR